MTNGLHFEPASLFLAKHIPPPKWILENQLAEGCLSLVVGQPKTGKSCFVRSLIKSVASGEPFLGRKTFKCPIAYLALEEHPSFLKESMARANMNFDHIHLHHGSSKNNSVKDNLNELKVLCEDFQIKFVVIDPLIKFTKISKTNDYSETVEAITQLVDFARESNVHVQLVHHANKGRDDSPTQILGSTGFFGSSDGALFISRKDKIGTLKTNLRYGDSLESINFGFDQNGLVTFQGLKSENDCRELGDEILSFLKVNSPALSTTLREELGVRNTNLKQALDSLLEQGLIDRSGTGRSNSPFQFFIPTNVSKVAESEKTSNPNSPLIESNTGTAIN